MDKVKWLLMSVVVVCLTLEGMHYAYKAVQRRRQDSRPPKSYVYDIKRFETLPGAETLYRELPRVSLDFSEPRGIAAAPGNRIVVVGDQDVRVLDASGEERRRVGLDAAPSCVTVDAATNIYVGVADHIEVIAPGAPQAQAWTSLGENAQITSVSVGATNLFAADYGHRVVWRYDLSGRLLGQLGTKDRAKGVRGFVLPSAYFDVVADSDAVWAVNPGRQSVEQHRLDGTVAAKWGEASMALEGFCGCCNPSHLARTADGRFVTSEKGLPRVKLYEADGTYVGLVAGTDAFARDSVGLDLAVDGDGRILVLDPAAKALRVFVPKAREE
jgi:hypothetical protein